MANVINLKKAYEEFEIGEKTYKLYLTDEKIKKWSKDFDTLGDKALSVDEDKENIDESRDMAMQLFDLLFGEGSGSEIYEMCGESTYVLMDVFRQIVPYMEKKVDELKELEVRKYTE
ncbi:MAG: hypothetical protein L0J63_01205 [Tetragenococcus koreensis]|nr:hypothetical protein [Tetragenococcus koreensis]